MMNEKILHKPVVRLTLLIPFIFVALLFTGTSYPVTPKDSTPTWISGNNRVAHALGGIHNLTYTNSLEAFSNSYNHGIRAFEVDLSLTSDGHLVAKHDWIQADNSLRPMSLVEFLNTKIKNIYTPLTFKDLACLMKEHRDIYIITDTKKTKKEDVIYAFKEIRDIAARVDPSILDRIIPQIYNHTMYDIVKEIYPFKNSIFTLYASADTDEEAYEFAVKNNIKVMTMSTNRCTPEFLTKLKKKGIYVYTYTINNAKDIERLQNNGVYGFYTDFLF